jgi:class 3 adenylate cyclase/tetratricopeptide (TPR) repeat protein
MELPSGARFCLSCGTSVSSAPAAEERKFATMVFADLAGSTAFASTRDPEYVRDVLDRYYDAMTAEIVDRGGTLEKFIGDAVVAVFGAPVAREDHPERALDAALAMQRRFAELFAAERLALRIGVNSGEVVLGRARESSSFVSGDTVNVAARLEQAAPPGAVLVGERTVAAVGAAFEFGEATRVEAKGKSGGVPARLLVRMLAETRPRGALGGAFVGRADELAWLSSQLQQCIDQRRPRLAVIIGDAGVGKTTLLAQFRSHLPPATGWRVGRCASFGRATTYSPLADVLHSEPAAKDLLRRWPILSVALGEPIPAATDPRVAAEQLRTAWVGLLTDRAAEQPTVMVIEDLHWASEPMLALLSRVASDARGPLLLVASTRPGQPAIEGANALELVALAPSAVDEMLSRLLGQPLPPAAHDLVIEQGDGNPFFIEEIINAFIDHALLRSVGRIWAWQGATAALDIPDSVHALIASRIDLLPPEAKAELQSAAVIGRVFGEPALQKLASADHISTLVRRGFVISAGSQLMFKHALTRDVAYSSLPKTRRALLHASYASWLEQTTGGDDANVGVLAHHYGEAADPDIGDLAWRGRDEERARLLVVALQWLRRAADVAIAAFDIDSALGFLDRATKLSPADGEIWQTIGRANALKYAGPAFSEAMLRAIELTDDPGGLGALYSELAAESLMRGAMWPTPPDPEQLKSWVDKSLELAQPGTTAQAQAHVAKAMTDDDPATARAAVAIANDVGDITLVARAHHALWMAMLMQGDYCGAHEVAGKALALVDDITDPDAIATIHQSRVATAISVGDFEEAEQAVDRMAAVAERLSAHHAVHVMGARLSVCEARDEWPAIRARQSQVEAAVAANSATPCSFNARLLLSCAVACAETDALEEAARLESAQESLGLEGYHPWFDPLRARLAILRGDHERLARLLEEAEKWSWPVFVHCYGVRLRLESMLALGRLEDAVHEAERYTQRGTYLEPYAVRALALAGDEPAGR